MTRKMKDQIVRTLKEAQRWHEYARQRAADEGRVPWGMSSKLTEEERHELALMVAAIEKAR